jgi:hypothetical protein
VPAAGTRLPGEIWTTFPDLQLGVIDASRNAQRLIAVRYFSASANYATGDCVWQAGKLYLANGPIAAGAFSISQWTQIASMTDVGAVSPHGDNRIINGDMRIDQRNNGASGTAIGYTVDRWQYVSNQVGKIAWQRLSGPVMTGNGYPYYLGLQSSSAYASLAGDSFYLTQIIEADTVGDFAWGTANAQPVTLSFWAIANGVSGTFSGSLRNYPTPSTRSYPFTFTLPASVWTKIVITIPGDTAGTWVMSGNAAALGLNFDLGCGSTFRGPAGAWASGNYLGANGAQSVVAANSAVIQITGVKLEIGSVATSYNRQSLAKSMADCQRYYQLAGANALVYAAAATYFVSTNVNFQTMRAAPTASLFSVSIVEANVGAVSYDTMTTNSLRMFAQSNAAGQANLGRTLALNAEL